MSRFDAWDVILNGKVIDTIFCDKDAYDAWHMKHSLVNHDGYDPSIKVRKVR